MRYLVLLLFLTGCSTTVPVTQKFPEPPKYAMERCPQLMKLNPDAKLKDTASAIIYNYSTYYECAVKTDSWIEWYGIQKNIFESVK